MRFSALLHPESAPVALDDTFRYVILSALQWKTPNLELMVTASRQRFAVLYNQPLEESFTIETLEQAHIWGAMSGVKLVAVHKDELRVFLSAEVVGSNFPAIEELWKPIKGLDINRRLEVYFSSEHEAYSGRSDYLFWPAGKKALDSSNLGIQRYEMPVLNFCTEDIFNADDSAFLQFHPDIFQSSTSENITRTGFCPNAMGHIDSMIGHSSYSMMKCYLCPPQKSHTP
ncbi:hypothetical protein V2L00_01375 [Pseudomonas alliivorans]|nr:hypothetical protein [Pseudomonas alliivorans]